MKTNLLWGLACLFFLGSCNDENNTPLPNESVTKALYNKYPSAIRVKWETKNSYITAEFINERQANTAWFDNSGQWYMTETELNNINELPEKVLTTFSNSEYKDWIVEDLDRLERLNAETIFVIEVKKETLEYDLYYTEDGILIKSIADDENDDYENYLPEKDPASTAIHEFINSKYPGARIVEIENEHQTIEVDIIHENRGKEVVFDINQKWINTHYDISKQEVETIVLEALNNSAYHSYVIDDIEKYETPSGDYYLFELEKGQQEIKIKMDREGNMLT